MLKIIGPERFSLMIKNVREYAIRSQGKIVFSNNNKIPKLYIVSNNNRPVYVGITTQPIKKRLYYGFTTTGAHGYHGYAWRKHYKNVDMYIWLQKDENKKDDVEAVEAEVVHQSTSEHRKWARKILRFFK
jgi:predicted GIY-YIG superfamily endonuclease